MRTPVLILGAGGTGLDVVDLLGMFDCYDCIGFLDDDPAKHGAVWGGLPVVGSLRDARNYPAASYVDALGGPDSFRHRREIIARSQLATDRFLTLIHPSATVSPQAQLGAGCLIYPSVVIGAGAVLGLHVTVLAHTVINHEAVICDWSILTSHVVIGGRARIGTACYLGAGAAVIQDGEVGDSALIGMGAMVLRSVPAGATMVGNPARQIRSLTNEDLSSGISGGPA